MLIIKEVKEVKKSTKFNTFLNYNPNCSENIKITKYVSPYPSDFGKKVFCNGCSAIVAYDKDYDITSDQKVEAVHKVVNNSENFCNGQFLVEDLTAIAKILKPTKNSLTCIDIFFEIKHDEELVITIKDLKGEELSKIHTPLLNETLTIPEVLRYDLKLLALGLKFIKVKNNSCFFKIDTEKTLSGTVNPYPMAVFSSGEVDFMILPVKRPQK